MSKIKDPFIVKCFCDGSNKSGNPAGIYIDQFISDEEKQLIASKLKFPVTVFVTNAMSDIPLIEFFYPNRKMPICLHGTLAATHILFSGSPLTKMSIRTPGGKILLVNKNLFNHFEVQVISEQVIQPFLSLPIASRLLNIDISDIPKNLPFTVASVGSPKLLIPINSKEKLVSLDPNYSAIANWSLKNKVNGLYAYFHDAEADIFHARGFNPITGHDEDAATGVAGGALALQLSRNIDIMQGQVLGQSCKINIRFESPNSIWVGGETLAVND